MFTGLFGCNGVGALSAQTHIALTPISEAVLVIAALLSLWKWRVPRQFRQGAWIELADNAFVLVLLALCVIIVGASDYSPFLYYRF